METTDINKKAAPAQSGEESKSKGSKIGKGLGAAAAMSAAAAAGGLAGAAATTAAEAIEEPLADGATATAADDTTAQETAAEETIIAEAATEPAEPELDPTEARPITAEAEIVAGEVFNPDSNDVAEVIDINDVGIIYGEIEEPDTGNFNQSEVDGLPLTETDEYGNILIDYDYDGRPDVVITPSGEHLTDEAEIAENRINNEMNDIELPGNEPGDDLATGDELADTGYDMPGETDIDIQSDIIV